MNMRIGLTTCAWMLALLSSAPASAQHIYKWTDANGQVHFSDQPPPDQAKVDVVGDLPRAGSPQPQPTQPAAAEVNRDDESNDVYPGTPEYDARRNAEMEQHKAESDKRNAAEAKRNQEMAASREHQAKLADDELIAKCKRNREVYCGNGADEIRRSELENEWHKYDRDVDAMRARSLHPPGYQNERVRDPVSPSQPRPGPPESLYDKQKNKNKKK
jgi:hypothetical protein